jgi:hypothetical protein
MKQTAYISYTVSIRQYLLASFCSMPSQTTYSWHWGDGRGLRWVQEEKDDSPTAKVDTA